MTLDVLLQSSTVLDASTSSCSAVYSSSPGSSSRSLSADHQLCCLLELYHLQIFKAYTIEVPLALNNITSKNSISHSVEIPFQAVR